MDLGEQGQILGVLAQTASPTSGRNMTDPPAPPQVSPDGRFFWDGEAWQPLPVAAASSPPEQTFHEFDVDIASVWPGGRRLIDCHRKITDRRVVVTDAKGNTQQALFRETTGVQAFGRLPPEVRITCTTESFTLKAGKRSREIVAWIQEAMAATP